MKERNISSQKPATPAHSRLANPLPGEPMSEERSVMAYTLYQDAANKLDHLVTGFAVALVAYLGVRTPTARLGWNPSTVELIALAAFVGSAYCGLKRLERATAVLGAMHRGLHESEAAQKLTGLAVQGHMIADSNTGQVQSADEAIAKAEYHRARARAVNEHSDKVGTTAAQWFRWRDRLLISGLVLLGLARLLAAVQL